MFKSDFNIHHAYPLPNAYQVGMTKTLTLLHAFSSPPIINTVDETIFSFQLSP